MEEVSPGKITVTHIRIGSAVNRQDGDLRRVNYLTNVMVGPDFVNEPGVDPDIVKWFVPGDYVEIIQSKKNRPVRSCCAGNSGDGEAGLQLDRPDESVTPQY